MCGKSALGAVNSSGYDERFFRSAAQPVMRPTTASAQTRRSLVTPARVGVLAVLLSAVAVFIVATRGSAIAPASFVKWAELLTSPGELLCLATVGGAFSGCPRQISGYTVWVAGAAVFWFLFILAARKALSLVRRVRNARAHT